MSKPSHSSVNSNSWLYNYSDSSEKHFLHGLYNGKANKITIG